MVGCYRTFWVPLGAYEVFGDSIRRLEDLGRRLGRLGGRGPLGSFLERLKFSLALY